MDTKIHSIASKSSLIFVSILIAIIGMPETFEYVLAQQQPEDSQQSSSSESNNENFLGIQDEQRSGVERDSQDIRDEDSVGTPNYEQRSGVER